MPRDQSDVEDIVDTCRQLEVLARSLPEGEEADSLLEDISEKLARFLEVARDRASELPE